MNNYFITGSSSGIGKALVEELLNYPNNKVIGISRTNTLSDKQFEHWKCDLSKGSEVKAFNFEKIERADRIVLINNAGDLGEIAYVGQQSDDNIIASSMVNFTSAAVLMNKFISAYQDFEGEKIIVNVSSGAANSAYDGWANYCSAKAALNMFTQVIHEEQQAQNFPIQAYAIAPGVVDTLMQDTIREVEERSFSRIEKFRALKENNELYQAHAVAERMLALIMDPKTIPSLISRIQL
ncbi:SDR family NAD(P)-dependent oxidoreductase [Chitinophagales bacterium]|nr:SDR family NAD(P)-dependent oxidoreductase [Chitinophagales bacterium]